MTSCLSVHGLWSLIFYIFHFSATIKQNSTKLDRKQDLNDLYQVCVLWANWTKNKMAALASDWLRHFQLIRCNCWMAVNSYFSWQEGSTQHPLPSLSFVMIIISLCSIPKKRYSGAQLWSFGHLVFWSQLQISHSHMLMMIGRNKRSTIEY